MLTPVSYIEWNSLLSMYPHPEVNTQLEEHDVVFKSDTTYFACCFSDPVVIDNEIYPNILVYSPSIRNKNILAECNEFMTILSEVSTPQIAVQSLQGKWFPFFRKYPQWRPFRSVLYDDGKRELLLIRLRG